MVQQLKLNEHPPVAGDSAMALLQVRVTHQQQPHHHQTPHTCPSHPVLLLQQLMMVVAVEGCLLPLLQQLPEFQQQQHHQGVGCSQGLAAASDAPATPQMTALRAAAAAVDTASLMLLPLLAKKWSHRVPHQPQPQLLLQPAGVWTVLLPGSQWLLFWNGRRTTPAPRC
jgi:hypothetical protein